ncbi:MAG: NAD(P)-dependent alcohol dehydrogenase [Thermofilaceae archaeon]
MRAAVLYGPGDLRFEERDRPAPGPGEALVRVKVCGICRSDYHYWKHGRIGEFVVRKPLILGHEASGIVEEVGEGVERLKPGDGVVIEPGVPCGRCFYCRAGRYNLCPHVRFMGTPPVDGAFVEYVSWPADFLYKMPAGMSFEEGALIEPLSVAVHAVRRARLEPGSSVAIFGVGAIGMVTLEAVRAAGAGRIFVVDVDDWKLDLALRRGAEAAINAVRENPVEAIKRLTGGEGVDYVFEASGAEKASYQSVKVARRGGVVVLVGLYASDEFQYPVLEAIIKEVDIRGVHRYANAFQPAIELVAKGRVKVADLVTHKIPLERLEEGFRIMDEGRERYIKIQVDVTR